MSEYKVVNPNEVADPYEGTTVPGEFRRLTPKLESEQIAVTLIRIPPHSDFEQSTGHFHEDTEEVYIVTKGVLTMRFNDDIIRVGPGEVARVAPQTKRSHRNEGGEAVEMWAISRKNEASDAHKIDDFWEASDQAAQTK